MDLARLAARIAPLAVVGCLAPAPVPDPVRVEPSWAYNGEDTPIRIVGTQFYPALGISQADGSGPDLGYHVSLRGPVPGDDEHEIVFVGQSDLTTLSAVVPAGLQPGAYDVVVESASGQVGVEPAAIEVRDTRIDGIDLTWDALTHEVYEPAEIGIALLDADSNVVAEDLEVIVELVDADGAVPPGAALEVDGLEDAIGVGTTTQRGRLGEDGLATAYPELRTPGEATLRVRAVSDAERVREDDVGLTWVVGADLRVEITLPTADFTTRAGDPFVAVLRLVDDYGNLAEGASVLVAITDTCNSWGKVVRLSPTAEVSVRPTVASGTSRCPIDALYVTGAGVGEATSDTFEVLPGALAGLEAEVPQSIVSAGELVTVLVRPVDAYGNVTAWAEEIAGIDDGYGGVADFSCQRGFTYNCSVLVTRAAPVVQLELVDTLLRTGSSNPFAVEPGAAEQLVVGAVDPVWAAGEAHVLQVSAVDAWGNPLPAAELDEAAIEVDGATGPMACDVGTPGDGRLTCRAYDARQDTLVVAAPGLEADQVDVTVVNGPLAHVDVVPDVPTVAAGDALGVGLVATDAWGNPWQVRADGALELASSTDAFRTVSVVVGPSGATSALVRPTFAGVTEIVATRLGVEVGRSAPVLVEPGPSRSLQLTLGEPWAWVGEVTPLRVEALDLYGNRTGLTDLIEVTTVSGAASATVLVQNGLGEGSLTWSRWVLDDDVQAVDVSTRAVTGWLAPVGAFRACAPSASPAVDVSFGGSSFARACTDAAGRATITAQVLTQAASGGQVTAFGLAVGPSVAVSATATVRLTLIGAGVYDARALAVQTDGCATEIATSAWIGPRDGSPVGPLQVSLDRTELDLAGTRRQATVRVDEVRTCDGLPAVGHEVLVRTDRGQLLGATPTGAGLAVEADAGGAASATLDASTADEGGPTVVTAWTPAGLARGATPATIRGDVRPPTVRSFSAEGATSEVSTAVVRFSERMDPTTLTPAAVLLNGPFAPTFTVRSIDGNRGMALDFDPPLAPTPDGWQLVVQPSVRDVAGNLLAGTWLGRTDAWSGWFGASSEVAPVSSCTVDLPVFRPDGDDGVGAEHDSVRLSYASAGTPVWWALEVTDGVGAVVRSLQLVPGGSSGAWRWDGRDETGAVVRPGRYQLTVDTKGSRGTRGGACTREVTVDLIEGTP